MKFIQRFIQNFIQTIIRESFKSRLKQSNNRPIQRNDYRPGICFEFAAGLELFQYREIWL